MSSTATGLRRRPSCRSARAHARADGNSVQSGRVGRGDARARKRMYQAGVVDRDNGAEHASSKSLGMTTDMLSRPRIEHPLVRP